MIRRTISKINNIDSNLNRFSTHSSTAWHNINVYWRYIVLSSEVVEGKSALQVDIPQTQIRAPPLPKIDSHLGPRHIVVLLNIILYTWFHDIYPLFYSVFWRYIVLSSEVAVGKSALQVDIPQTPSTYSHHAIAYFHN